MRHHLAIAALLSSSIVWACSAADPNTPGGSSKESDSKSADSKTPNKTTAGSSSGGSSSGNTTPPPAQDTNPTEPAPTGGQCTAAQGEEACTTCCETNNPKGSEAADGLDDKWTQCVCAPAACATQCAATACGPNEEDPADGDACSKCIENLPCDDQWDTACQANADCAALMTCQEPCSPEDGEDLQAGGNGLPEEMKQLRELKVRTAKAVAKHRQILERHRSAVQLKAKLK